jgi:hypothetical protein
VLRALPQLSDRALQNPTVVSCVRRICSVYHTCAVHSLLGMCLPCCNSLCRSRCVLVPNGRILLQEHVCAVWGGVC